jgi:hypothetical protein
VALQAVTLDSASIVCLHCVPAVQHQAPRQREVQGQLQGVLRLQQARRWGPTKTFSVVWIGVGRCGVAWVGGRHPTTTVLQQATNCCISGCVASRMGRWIGVQWCGVGWTGPVWSDVDVKLECQWGICRTCCAPPVAPVPHHHCHDFCQLHTSLSLLLRHPKQPPWRMLLPC